MKTTLKPKFDDASLQHQFLTLLADLRDQKETAVFLTSFLTDSELTTLSKRLEILKLMHEDYSYEEIQNALKVSSATISSLAPLKDAPTTQVVLKKLALEEWAENIVRQLHRLRSSFFK